MLGYNQTTLWSHDLKVPTSKRLTTQLLHTFSVNWIDLLQMKIQSLPSQPHTDGESRAS